MPGGTKRTTTAKGGNKIPYKVVPKGDCNASLSEGKMFAEGIEGVTAMFDRNPESCPKLYECPKIKMAPMIRALLRCTADEAMRSICANCDERQEGQASQAVTKGEKTLLEKKS